MLDYPLRRKPLRPVRAARIVAGVAASAALTFCALHNRPSPAAAQSGHSARNTPRLTPAAWQMPAPAYAQTQATPALIPALKISVDSGATLPADPTALRSMFAPDAASQEAGARVTDAAWYAWGHLEAGRAKAHVTPSSEASERAVGVYAVRWNDGVTLCLVNRTDARLNTTAEVRLPRGVYTVERLTVTQEKRERKKEKAVNAGLPVQTEETTSSEASFPSHLPLERLERLERLEGCEMGAASVISKPLCLLPRQICLYRYTDVAHASRAAWQEVFGQLDLMARDHGSQAHRLGTMLHEADGYISGVRGETRHSSIDSRLGCIHHLLLVTAQAHSLHHNYQMRHTVDEAEGRAVMAALDRLTDALSETSAALLGLIPQMDVTPAASPSSLQAGGVNTASAVRPVSFSPSIAGSSSSASSIASVSAGKADKKEENTRSAPNLRVIASKTGAAANERVVTVTLANTGERRISNVKLGLNMNALPSGVVCEPSDPAYFGSLPPGQTIRATFHLRAPSGQTLPTTTITGDVSYFAGTAPAHLRPRAW